MPDTLSYQPILTNMLGTKVMKTSILPPRLQLGTILNDEAPAVYPSETKIPGERHFMTHAPPRITAAFPAACLGGSRSGHKVQTNVIFTGSWIRDEKSHRKGNGLNGTLSLRNLFGYHGGTRLRPLKALNESWSGCKKLLYNTLGIKEETIEEEDILGLPQLEKQSTYKKLQNEARKWDKQINKKQYPTRLFQITEKKAKEDDPPDLQPEKPKIKKPPTPVIHSFKRINSANRYPVKKIQGQKRQLAQSQNLLHKLSLRSDAASPRKETVRNYIEARTVRPIKELKKDVKESAISQFLRKGIPEEKEDKKEAFEERSSVRPAISFHSLPKFLKKPNPVLHSTPSSTFLRVAPTHETQANYKSTQNKLIKKTISIKDKSEKTDKPEKSAEPEITLTPFEPVLSARTKRAMATNNSETEKRQDKPLRDVKLFKDTHLEWWNTLLKPVNNTRFKYNYT